jgi:hypothetical protein
MSMYFGIIFLFISVSEQKTSENSFYRAFPFI